MLSGWIDGNWIDVGSIAIAASYAAWKAKCRPNQKIISKATSLDLANGTSLFPLLLLGMSIISSELLRELLGANKLILSVAGFCALLAMLEEEPEPPVTKRTRKSK